MKTNYLDNRVQWRRSFSTDGFGSVTGMAMSPDDINIVVVGNTLTDLNWSVGNLITVIRADTGGHVNEALKLTLGTTGLGEHLVFDGGLHYSASGSVFLAFF